MVPDGGDGVPCDYCAAQRALLHCAQHGARLCLLCDVPVHGAAGAHSRAPLCQGCHAAAADVRCAVHRASLCAHCARAAGCDAEGHAWSPTRSFNGFPHPADLARLLYIDAAPPPADVPPPPTPALHQEQPPVTWVPDLVNVEQKAAAASLHGSSSRTCDEQCRIMIENECSSSSLIETGGNFGKQEVAGDDGAAVAAAVALPTGGGEGDASGLFTQDYSDWYNCLLEDPAGDGGQLDNVNFADDGGLSAPMANSLIYEKPEAAWWSSSGYDADPQPLNPSSSYSLETVTQASTDHAMESVAGNNAAFGLSSPVLSIAANSSTGTTPYQLHLLNPLLQQLSHLQQGQTPYGDWLVPPQHQLPLPPPHCKFFNSGLPMWPPDEFPSRHLGNDDEHLTPAALVGGTTVVDQDPDAPMQQQAESSASVPVPVPMPEQESSQDMEARKKLKERRMQAIQKYRDKRKDRKFGKQIMYVCRKERADTRNRVKGRFAKVSTSGSGGHGDRNGDDHPTHS